MIRSRCAKVLLLSIVVVVCLACGGGWFNNFQSIFYPETADVKDDFNQYFYRHSATWYDNKSELFDNQTGVDESYNARLEMIKAWKKHTYFVLSNEEIEASLFESSSYLEEYLIRFKMTEELNYLKLLQHIDSSMTKENWYDIKVEKDTASLKNVLNELQNLNKNTTNDFLKPRYSYQIIRCLFHLDKHSQLHAYYNENQDIINKELLIANLAKCMNAGSYYHEGDVSRSYYEFSKIFNSSADLRFEAAKNIKIYNMPLHANVLSLCKNDLERASVHVLACLKPNEDISAQLRQVVNYEPKNKYIPLIVTRMINKFEQYYVVDTLSYDDDYNKEYYSNIAYGNNAIEEVDTMLTLLSDLIRIDKQPIYHLAKSYIYYVKGEYDSSMLYLSMVPDNQPNVFINKQKMLLDVLCRLKSKKPLEASDETEMLKKIVRLRDILYDRDYHGLKIISKNLAIYFKNSSPRRNLSASLFDIKLHHFDEESLHKLNTLELENLVSFFNIEHKSTKDSLLIAIAEISPDDAFMALGRRYMTEMRWNDAREVFKRIPSQILNELTYNEYVSTRPKLWFKSNVERKGIENISVYIDTLVAVQSKAIQYPNDAKILYELALHQLNLTYYGNAWSLSQPERSTNDTPLEMYPIDDVAPYFWCSHAMKTIENCLRIAKGDMKVKAAYLASLIENFRYHTYTLESDKEENNYFSQPQREAFDLKMKNIKRDSFSIYKILFIKDTKDSKYKKMIIRECDYIRKAI